jgi:hypothetical protein
VATGLQQDKKTEYREPLDRSSQSVAGLLYRLSHELSTLLRQELALAVAELTQTLGKTLTAGAVTIAGGTLMFGGVLGLMASAVLGLSHIMAAWLAALLVGVAVSVIGVVVVGVGMHAMPNTLRPALTARSLLKDKNVLIRRIL